MLALELRQAFSGKRSRQVAFLYLSTLVSLVAGLAVSVVNARLLGERQFGDLKFLQNIFALLAGIVNFGVYASASRLLAHSSNQGQKDRIVGAIVTSTATLSLLFTATLVVYSFVPYSGASENLGFLIRLFSPLMFVYPFQLCLENMMQGDNRIYDLSWFRVLPLVLYLAAVIVLVQYTSLSLMVSLALQQGLLAAIVVYYVWKFKPRFSRDPASWSKLRNENRTYGFPVYIGSLAGVVSAQLGGVLVGYFVDNVKVGFFSLATTVTMPLALLPNIIGTTFFKDYAQQPAIPLRVQRLTLLITVGSFVAFLFLIKTVFFLLFPAQFAESVHLSYILAVGTVFHGVGDYYNKFLSAHGRGRELRNGALVVGIINLGGYALLTYLFGVYGAAWTRVFAGIGYFLLMLFSYKGFQRDTAMPVNV